MDIYGDLARVRRGHQDVLDRALSRLARWMDEHPDATEPEITSTEEYGRVLSEFGKELREMHGVLSEVLPAMIEDALRGTA